MREKFWIRCRWSKDWSWDLTDKDGILHHHLFAIEYTQDNEPDAPILRAMSIYFFKFNINFIWTP